MKFDSDRAKFWDGKILTWEKSRYENSYWTGWALQARMRIAARFLNSQNKKLSLVDLGCGSGRLFELIDRSRFSSLMGLDVSESAIREASRKFSDNHVSFSRLDVTLGDLPPAECFVALGLLDWLTDSEIEGLFSRVRSRYFLFSFSEKRSRIMILIHSIFLRLAGQGSTSRFRPRYQSLEEVVRLAGPFKDGQISVYRHRSMAFGTFITNLPIDTGE